MTKWPQFPVVYEINTWIWLQDLGQAAGAPVTLDQVPDSELDRLAGLGFDGVWLMGVWQRSPQGRQVALEHQELQAVAERGDGLGRGAPGDLAEFDGAPSIRDRALLRAGLHGVLG